MNKQRPLIRKRNLLSLLPMAVIVLGASPGRPLQIGSRAGRSLGLARKGRGRSVAGATSSPISTSARSRENSLFRHPRRTESKIRHVIHSDNFSHDATAHHLEMSRECRVLTGERLPHGPWLEEDIVTPSLYAGVGSAVARVPIWHNLRRKTRLVKRGLMELAVKSVQIRNLQWNLRNSSIRPSNNVKVHDRTTGIIADNARINRGKNGRMLLSLFNLFDRKSKSSLIMETMDTMDVMTGDMNAVEYMKAMAVLSPNDHAIGMNKSGSHKPTKVVVDNKVRKNNQGRWSLFKIKLFQEGTVESPVLSSRGGAITTSSAITTLDTAASKNRVMKYPSTDKASTPTNTLTESVPQESTGSWIIETPLFPIILPKSWEPLSAAESASIKESSTVVTSEFMEISVALEEEEEVLMKPSLQTLQTATQPLVPKASWSTLKGNEFYYPESMEMLARTGLVMALGNAQVVDWVGEKKTVRFLQDHCGSDSQHHLNSPNSLTEALTTSQEVLVWSGKFTSSDGQGAELPIVKTMAVIDKSPKYLAELLMDSNKVRIYNKMSLGRSDELVFQMGVDTVNGSFGDGESKVVRNLTKPPMMNNILEFISKFSF
eukprot:CCRYP_014939-RA/>CCRYP_014939-RA protein AED:0.04 eAED:0.04 QI:151/1/1/1/1/1/2/611/601